MSASGDSRFLLWVFCRAFSFSSFSLPPPRCRGAEILRLLRMKQADPFYKSSRWRRRREMVLRRDGYQCQYAKRYGKIVPADIVHHIFPRDKYPQYQWELWNLVSLSNEAHNRMHNRQTDELTEEGMELLKRTARKKGIEL